MRRAGARQALFRCAARFARSAASFAAHSLEAVPGSHGRRASSG